MEKKTLFLFVFAEQRIINNIFFILSKIFVKQKKNQENLNDKITKRL